MSRHDEGERRYLNPLVRGLINALPSPGEPWPKARRQAWCEAALAIFALLYEDEDTR